MSPASPVRLNKGIDGEMISDTLSENGRPIPLDEKTVYFRMRAANSEQLKADEQVTVIDLDTSRISYAPSLVQKDTQGFFYGWWRVIDGVNIVETAEFLILIDEHAPGEGTRTGVIYDAARAEIPVDWDALVNYPAFGDIELQKKVELVKLRVLHETILPQNENSLDLRVQDYIAKLAVLEVIPAAISYWRSQMISRTVRQTDEIATYPDRIKSLEQQQKDLLAKLALLEPEICILLGFPTVSSSAPDVDTIGELVTSGLEEFPLPYGRRRADVNAGSLP